MGNEAVSNTGPIIHLAQIGIFEALSIFETIYIPGRVFKEICISEGPGTKELKETQHIKSIQANEEILANVKENIDVKIQEGEMQAIALCKQLSIPIFLTDDLTARKVGKGFGLEVHGSIGVISRAYREGMIDFAKARQALDELYYKSTLYISKVIIDEAKDDLEKYSLSANQ